MVKKISKDAEMLCNRHQEIMVRFGRWRFTLNLVNTMDPTIYEEITIPGGTATFSRLPETNIQRILPCLRPGTAHPGTVMTNTVKALSNHRYPLPQRIPFAVDVQHLPKNKPDHPTLGQRLLP